ncbi:hypothetical protein ACMFMG_007299 [Clarireedia jacksonii]
MDTIELAQVASTEVIEEESKVIRPPKLDPLEGIFVRSVDCLERFRNAVQILKETRPSQATSYGYDLEFSLFTIQDAFAHFKAWGNNIAAFHDGVLRSSLEFRLKEASEIRQRILKILGNLQVSLYEARLIITGKEPNEHWPIEEFSDEDEDEALNVEPEQTSELQELLKAMKDANANLLKLSMVIRNSPSRDDYLKAATRYQFDPSYDIGHVREKHGSAKGMSEWLIIRLGKAVTRRRQFLKYREDHHGKLTRDWDQMAVEEGDKTVALTKATTFIEDSAVVRMDGSELGDSFGSQTSYEATIVGESSGKLSVPSHPKMAFNGVTFEFGKPFQCPYCFTEQVVKNRSAWKKHVFRDLRPYVCTFKECDMRMFCSRNEWFVHELQNHRREWACQQCQHAPFSSSSEYEAHLRMNHHIELQASQIKALLLQSEEPVDKVTATACRLCNDWETTVENPKHDSNLNFLHGRQLAQPYGTLSQFRRHLGRHMEQLALFALPIAEDAMEDDSLSEEGDDEQTSISLGYKTTPAQPVANKSTEPIFRRPTVEEEIRNHIHEVEQLLLKISEDKAHPPGRLEAEELRKDLRESRQLLQRSLKMQEGEAHPPGYLEAEYYGSPTSVTPSPAASPTAEKQADLEKKAAEIEADLMKKTAEAEAPAEPAPPTIDIELEKKLLKMQEEMQNAKLESDKAREAAQKAQQASADTQRALVEKEVQEAKEKKDTGKAAVVVKKLANERAEWARKAAEAQSAIEKRAAEKQAELEKKAAAAAAAAPPPDDKKKPIRFKDAIGRKFSFPFQLCATWSGMEELIKQAFLHVEVIGPYVQEGHYDLIGPNGEIILPQVWETVIEPDWSITMHMRPPPGPKAAPPGRRQSSRRQPPTTKQI